MNISKAIEVLFELRKVYGDVEVVMEDPIYGHVPAEISVTLERGTYEVMVEPFAEPEFREWSYANLEESL